MRGKTVVFLKIRVNKFVFPKNGKCMVTTVESLTASSEAGEGGKLLLLSIAMHTRLRWEQPKSHMSVWSHWEQQYQDIGFSFPVLENI